MTAQHRLTHAGRTEWLDDLTGGGFTLLTDGFELLAALDRSDREFLRELLEQLRQRLYERGSTQ